MSYALKIQNVDFSSVYLDKVTYIEPIPCTGLSLSPSSLSFTTAEESKQLTVTKTPLDTTDTLLWSSSNENVATVVNGLVTIHGIGTTTITATCGNQTASVTITQSSIKAEYDLQIVAGKYPAKSNVDDGTYLKLSSGANESALGQTYHAGNTHLKIGGGSTNNIECVKVPYGATKVYMKTSDDVAVNLSYMHILSTTETVTGSTETFPKWLRTKEHFITSTGYDVVYGECLICRPGNGTSTSTLSYIYFE